MARFRALQKGAPRRPGRQLVLTPNKSARCEMLHSTQAWPCGKNREGCYHEAGAMTGAGVSAMRKWLAHDYD